MKIRVEVAGSATSVELRSLSIEKDLNGRSSRASFKIPVSDTRTLQQTEVIMYNDATNAKLFRGTIVNVKRKMLAPTKGWRIATCIGLEYLLENVIVSATYTAQTARQILQTAFPALLPEILTTNTTVANIGSAMTIEAKDWTLRQLVEEVARQADGEWRLDEDKNLVFRSVGSAAASFAFHDTPNGSSTRRYRSIDSESDAIGFANRVKALGALASGGSELTSTANDTASQTALGRIVTATVAARNITNQTALDAVSAYELTRRSGVLTYITLKCDHGSPAAAFNIPTGLDVGQLITVTASSSSINSNYTIQKLVMKQKSRDWTEYTLSLGDYKPELREMQRQAEMARKAPKINNALPPANSVVDSMVNNVSFGKVTSVSITNAMVVSIDFSKVTSVAVTNSQIVSVDFSKVTSVSITNSQIVSIDFSKVTSVSVTNSQIVSLDFSKVTSVSVTGSQIASLTITSSNIANLTITGSQIANATIASAKITDLDCSKLNAGTINAAISISSGGSLTVAGTTQLNGALTVAGNINITSVSGLLINGVTAINNGGVWVGNGVYTPLVGIAGAGFNPFVGGVQYFGGNDSWVDAAGKTITMKGGAFISRV